MARPRKCRSVCSLPQTEGLMPIGYDKQDCPIKVYLTLDEFEVIRLIDLEGLTHDECAIKMNISRPTVTNIYANARHTLADALVNEKILLIEGGDFIISKQNKQIAKIEKENEIMKIAVTYNNGEVFQHFGHCEEFKIYDVENGQIKASNVAPTMGSGHGALAGFLKNLGVEVLICGGIGGGAKTALAEAGIKLFGGVNGNADDAVKSLLADTLEYNADITCDHHGEGHTCGDGHGDGHGHGEGHNCGGNHGEGHKCNH